VVRSSPWEDGVVDSERERRHRFDALFDSYKVDVATYCRWRAPSPGDADDVLSEVFLIAWRRFDDIPEGGAARIWLYATARRVIGNQRRSRRRLDALRDRMAREPVAWPPTLAAGDETARVHEALADLNARDREVLLLAEWEDLTAAEIAQVLGCLVVTARGRLHRARRRFRDAFEARPIADEDEIEMATDEALRIRKAHT
jgi:RNA polymerase sigma-70 factor, ECF subfamily